MNAKDIISQLTLEEKADLCSGADFWNLKGVERLGLAGAMATDGPHGLRKQDGESDHLGLNASVPATCFPTASATASSFDRDLMREIGIALSEECLQENVSILLGPGANIKRSPLCGRNFEYISEDPYVTGEMAAALIGGIQSNNIGVSMKHFAANNQEKARMTSNSVVDERALREIYLAGFETAVKKEQPWTMMCSYNKINGRYACENPKLLTEILRDEWGFDGLVMTDWGAMDDRADAIAAGLDLEMPGPSAANSAKIIAAIERGKLTEEALDRCVLRILKLLEKASAARKSDYHYDAAAHNALARRAAAESVVLLKNEDHILPADKAQSIAVVGAFAKVPRYQGAGSSHITPHRTDCALDALADKGANVEYAEGYSLKEHTIDDALIAQAVALAKRCMTAFVFAGLPDDYESEGFDRETLAMPESHNALIEAVAAANPNTVVILQCGSPVQMPWLGAVKGVLMTYLGGQASGGACADVLLGDTNPSGKLAESFPLCIEDTPAYLNFAKDTRSAEYRESIFVGYRWYDSAKRAVLFPFGFGLSYTDFVYSNLTLSCDSIDKYDNITAEVTVTNSGRRDGAEVVQLYIAKGTSAIYRAEKELKGFAKVFLKAGESKILRFVLGGRSFAYYNIATKDWAIEGGNYKISVGGSSAKLPLSAFVTAQGDGNEQLLSSQKQDAPSYFSLPTSGILDVDDAEFIHIYGKELPPSVRGENEPFTENSTIREVLHTAAGQQLLQMLQQGMGAMGGGEMQKMFEAMIMDLPLRALGMMSGGQLNAEQLSMMIMAMNV